MALVAFENMPNLILKMVYWNPELFPDTWGLKITHKPATGNNCVCEGQTEIWRVYGVQLIQQDGQSIPLYRIKHICSKNFKPTPRYC